MKPVIANLLILLSPAGLIIGFLAEFVLFDGANLSFFRIICKFSPMF